MVDDFCLSFEPKVKRSIGRPCLFDRPLKGWERVRRCVERRKGKPDSLLVALGVSSFDFCEVVVNAKND